MAGHLEERQGWKLFTEKNDMYMYVVLIIVAEAVENSKLFIWFQVLSASYFVPYVKFHYNFYHHSK